MKENNQSTETFHRFYLPNFGVDGSIVGVDVKSGTVVLSVFIDEILSKYHFASPWRVFVFPCFRFIVDDDDDVDNGLVLRQCERCTVPDDDLLWLVDDERDDFSVGVGLAVALGPSEISGKWPKNRIFHLFNTLNLLHAKKKS